MIPGNQDEILRGERFQRCCHRFHVPYSLSKTLFFLKLITDPNDAELAFSQRSGRRSWGCSWKRVAFVFGLKGTQGKFPGGVTEIFVKETTIQVQRADLMSLHMKSTHAIELWRDLGQTTRTRHSICSGLYEETPTRLPSHGALPFVNKCKTRLQK